ncbi:MAG TPA: RimK family alpha-L-glutamate ligase [Candidatus Paceibacterota bacterium]|nr:RimK family alpha-L-glutamate ligase [Candidatus Paceibacterota bacterium]
MKIGILGRDISGWGTQQLKDSFQRLGVPSVFLSFSNVTARAGYSPVATVKNVDVVQELAALIIRPIGRGSLEEIIFRMDFLHRLERLGVLIVNPADAIEQSVDKYHALTLLEEKGLSVPRTVVTEDLGAALKCFEELGGDVVLKPLFGSKGIGSTRIPDVNIAERIFSSVLFHHGVLYLQEFIPHGNSDIRAFVVGKKVVAAMRRIANSWKTNVSQGAQPVALKLSGELETLAVKATEVVGCKVAGVDILEGENGPMVIELNSQPGWRGLQSVSNVNIADCIVNYVMAETRK